VLFTIPSPIYTVHLSCDLDYLGTEALLQRETNQCAWRFVYIKTMNEQFLHSQQKSLRESPALVRMMWTQLEKKILLRLPESMGLDFDCGKETGNFLTYRGTSISKVQCVSRVVTVIG